MAIRVFKGEHVWHVTVTLPKDEAAGRRWAENRMLAVVASTAARAIECAIEYYPGATVWGLQHKGSNDPSLVVAAEVLDGGQT
jgi:hypothetical protein